MKLFLLWIGLLTSEVPAEEKYPVSEIPESLTKGMYAVIREQTQEYEIKSINKAQYRLKYAITILNAKAKDYATLVVDYDKNVQVDFIDGQVYDAEGKPIKKLKNSDVLDRSAISGYSLYEDNRMKIADLSQEKYPYTVEFEYQVTKKVLYSIPGFSLYSDDEVSSQRLTYRIIYPATNTPRYQLYQVKEPGKMTLPDGRIQLFWSFENVVPDKFERWSPPINKVVPNIAFAPAEFEFAGYKGNMSTWKQIGQWQNLLNKGRDSLSNETRQRVVELTKGLATDGEKIKALYEYMQSKTRYVSVQLGIGGFQPIDAKTVDQVGYGDCKALSNYMISLLKLVGIKGYYSWVYGGDGMRSISPQFPIDYFNHIIVSVPQKKDTVWLECTSQTAACGFLGDFTSNRYALMVTEDGGKLVRTPRYKPEQNQQITKLDVTISSTGETQAKLNRTNTGLQVENQGLYTLGVSGNAEEQKKWLEKAFDLSSYNVKSYEIRSVKEALPTVKLNAVLEVRKYATVSGKRIFVSPNMVNRFTSTPDKAETRKLPIIRKMGYVDLDTVVYSIPEPFVLEFQPAPIKLTSKFGEYEAEFKLDQGKLYYYRRLKMNDGEFKAEAYNEWMDFLKGITKADNTKLVFVNKT